MNATEEKQDEIADFETMMVVKNVGKDTLRFVLRDDAKPHTPVPDPARLDPDGRPLPKWFGDPRVPKSMHHRYQDELHIELAPGQRKRLPRKFINNGLLVITCSLCRDSWANRMGRCKFLDDPRHRETAQIIGGGLIGDPTTVEIDAMRGIPLEATFARLLEEQHAQEAQPIPAPGRRPR